jgi:hypothetical protein
VLPVRRAAQGELRPGDWVEVRSASEILPTIDAAGETECLPIMLEMLKHCGRRFQVHRRADKTCDRITKKGLRRMSGTVHLAGLRCDGEGHGGCQAGCLLFWKEAWLRRVDPDASGATEPAGGAAASAGDGSSPAAPRELLAILERAARRERRPEEPEGDYYRCQATELNRATVPLPYSDLRQYYRDWRTGNVTLGRLLWWAVTVALDSAQRIPKTYRLIELLRGPFRIPHIGGTQTKTPKLTLDLQPGELVRVKSFEEILATLDPRGRNRGLSFDNEMVSYCGGTYRVLRRVERLVDEPTGRMVHPPGDCIILDEVVCQARYHSFCPKEIYPYWREIWLERVSG